MDPNATSQPGATPPAGGATPPVAPPDPQGGAATPPAATPPAPASTDVDLSKLTGDQLTKVLENPELWNLPRIKELREQAAAAKKLEADQAKAADDKLAADKKFEELATKKGEEVTRLQQQLQDMTINQQLTNKLAAEKVIDIDGALKLVDRSKLSVDGNGQVVGVDEALTSLKTDRAYLFTADGSTPPAAPTVGTPSNPAAPATPSGQFKFKESQLTPAFYNEHKAEVDAAGAAGLIEPDGPPQV